MEVCLPKMGEMEATNKRCEIDKPGWGWGGGGGTHSSYIMADWQRMKLDCFSFHLSLSK